MNKLQSFGTRAKDNLSTLRKELLYGHKNSQLNCGFFIDPHRFGAAIGGGWKEVARATLGSIGDTINVTSIPDKRYYMILHDARSNSETVNFGVAPNIRFNGVSTGNEYSQRRSLDGGTDITAIDQNQINCNTGSQEYKQFVVGYISNLASKEKLVQTWGAYKGANGSGVAPSRSEVVGKWENAANSINSIQMVNLAGGDYAVGAEVVVLAYDPDDTHADNAWEEIGSATGTGISDITLDSSKKYNMFAGYIKPTGGSIDMYWRAGNTSIDTNNNYSRRRSVNGGADSTNTGSSGGDIYANAVDTPVFVWGYIMNVSSVEKLCICHAVGQNAAGAGTAPDRQESVSKWANTSNQFNHFGIVELGAGSIHADSWAKVWGAN